jgi:uncharacterized protein
MSESTVIAAQTADWRHRVFALYARVREDARADPRLAHARWVAGRDELFASHPASPLVETARSGFEGLPVADYDPAWRLEAEIRPAGKSVRITVETGTDGVVPFELLGTVDIPLGGSLDVWRLASYGGGIFIPVKDDLAGRPGGTYGGGRYLFDTIKGADLGIASTDGSVTLTLDFNFAYNPSCAYDPDWACPLAQAGNTVKLEIPVGERYIA